MMDVFNRRRPDLEEQLGILTRHFERLAYLLLLLRKEHEGFGEKIRWGPKGRDRIDELWRLSAEALGNPFVSGRQVEEILREKSSDIKPLEEMGWKGKEKEQEERREQFQKDCEEAIYGGGDPDLPPDKVDFKGTTEYVEDGGRTHAVVGEGEPTRQLVMVEGTVAVEAGLNLDEWSEEEERKLVAELRRQWIETSEQRRKEEKETVGGLGMDELAAALEAAFPKEGVGSGESGVREEEEAGQEAVAGEPGVGSRDSGLEGALEALLASIRERKAAEAECKVESGGSPESGGSGLGTGEEEAESGGEKGVGSRESGVGEEKEGPERSEEEAARQEAEGGADGAAGPAEGPASSPTPDSRPPTPDPPDLREVTATAWDRVRFMEWWSKWEREEMKTILQRTGQTVRQTLEALLGLFRGYKKILFEATHYEAKLRDALFRFLTRLYGGDPGFEPPSSVWTDPELYQQMKNGMQELWAN